MTNLDINTSKGVISSQVVQEFFAVMTQKPALPMNIEQAGKYLNTVLAPLCECFTHMKLISRGLQIKDRYRYSFYSALIISAALETNCTILYSEDLQHGQKIDSLSILNPFKH